MENTPVEMAGLREGLWIVLGAWQRGAQSGYSGAGIPRIAEHDGELVLLMAGRQRLGAKHNRLSNGDGRNTKPEQNNLFAVYVNKN
ncbi:Diacylglycerol kinase theta [Dissostichus eleginoides]|uniref:Diacylglycerol kinase theta n=1 Tax=Dissostichus eleginoides TaxID=100907 RepID=A0AAD9ETZ9_DISEL|nr:Diacylglycerol kinase theta [Dissostichus eleginoides]